MTPDTGWAGVVHRFWFETLRPIQWFRVDPALDEDIRARFSDLHQRLRGLSPVAAAPREALAGVIVLDQFSRNLFRGTPEAFAFDTAALARAEAAIGAGFDAELEGAERQFLFMPFMHSESRTVQARSVQLFATLGQPKELDFARRHQTIIERFGRFPHRNTILGRASTPEEAAFVAEGGSF